jgi:GT2 family glycosyltransferase
LIDVALAGPSGMLVGGRLSDPARLVSRLDVEGQDGAYREIAWHFLPGPQSTSKTPAPVPFVAFVPDFRSDIPILQPRFRLHLASGTIHRLIPKLQPVDPVERRARALTLIPPQHLTDDLLADCLAPALADLQRAIHAAARPARTVPIGEPLPQPVASVVVPLYRNLEFLQAQVAAFALDPVFTEAAELIYVLDSPEQTAEVEQFLRGLSLLYRVPFTLVVMAENAGYAAACNAGAAVARGTCLAMLNSDVIPNAPGWLELLVGRLAAAPSLGAVGPKLLFEDGSIQHAGLHFVENHFGRVLNHHFHKGMPRDYAPATVERVVPAVTGACLIVRRDAFETVGGFTEDYVIGDYEDSDLCLKLRATGYDIAYVPAAELYHLERQSIRHHEDYMRGSADRYNGWLHARRWLDAIRQLADAPRAAPAMRSAA